MDRAGWAQPVSNEEAFRRAGGRRRYNALRREAALLRRQQLLQQLLAERRSLYDHGTAAWWSARAGVSRRTAQRDLAWVEAQLIMVGATICPLCGGGTGQLPRPEARAKNW
jgi:hypothetical protein